MILETTSRLPSHYYLSPLPSPSPVFLLQISSPTLSNKDWKPKLVFEHHRQSEVISLTLGADVNGCTEKIVGYNIISTWVLSPWFLELNEDFCWILLEGFKDDTDFIEKYAQLGRKSSVCCMHPRSFVLVFLVQGRLFEYIQSIGSNHKKHWGVMTVFWRILLILN